jgi:hypothetical protein
MNTIEGDDNRRVSIIIRNKTGFMSRSRREIDEHNPELYMDFHCIIRKESPCGRILKY